MTPSEMLPQGVPGLRLGSVVEPNPLPEACGPVFPLDVLPEWVGDFVGSVAATVQTPPDLPGSLSVAMLAVACSGKARIDLGPWTQPLSLYVVVAMPPASRKSEVFKLLTRPIDEFERAEVARLGPEVRRSEASRKSLERRIQKAIDGGDDPVELVSELERAPRIAMPQLYVDDCTAEAMSRALALQGGRLAVLSSEGGIFDILDGRHSQGRPNFEVFLKGNDGESLRVDRMGREGERVVEANLTVGLTVQPEVLRRMARITGAQGRGLLQRFLFAVPRSNVGLRGPDAPPLRADAQRAYEDGLRRLLAHPSGGELPALGLSPAAARVHRDFRVWVEKQIAPGADLADLAEWAGKLPSAVGRIAGLFQVADTGFSGEVAGDTMERAVQLGHYFVAHAQIAFGMMGADPGLEDARAVLHFIRRKGLRTFSERDLYQGLKGQTRFARVAALRSAVELLLERALILASEGDRKGRAGPRYILNISTSPISPSTGRGKPNGAVGEVGDVGSIK